MPDVRALLESIRDDPATNRAERAICEAALGAMRVCAECGAPFSATRTDAVFCSTRCRVTAHRKAHATP